MEGVVRHRWVELDLGHEHVLICSRESELESDCPGCDVRLPRRIVHRLHPDIVDIAHAADLWLSELTASLGLREAC